MIYSSKLYGGNSYGLEMFTVGFKSNGLHNSTFVIKDGQLLETVSLLAIFILVQIRHHIGI